MASANTDENMISIQEINILLLGETGVGKSTFINSFVNYLHYATFDDAMNSELIGLIPLKFTVPNEDYEDRIIEFMSDENEDSELGNSSTQSAKAYEFPFENYSIRFIDTPGIGDARGVDQDEKNFENVLAYIGRYKHLHAICFLLKPNVTVINAYFKFCIMHLLSRLEKSAASNIIFIFTNSRSTFYRPGETLPLLKKILNEVKQSPPHVDIPCSRSNMFCVDNEAFKFLVATKHGIQFNEGETQEFAMSWKTSCKTYKDILIYICGDKCNNPLPPHEIQNTISVNRARSAIIDLCKPLADISDVIQDNLTVLKRHKNSLEEENLSKKELYSKLYVPTINLEVVELFQPVTVCTASNCSEIYTCGEINKYHYKQKCHDPCTLKNVPKEIIGTPELLHCVAMGGGKKCIVCRCDFSAHMHIYYESQVVEIQQKDISIKNRIKTKEEQIQAKTLIIEQLNKKSEEYESEKEEISMCMAKFAHFLKENSISTYNDAYLDYLDYLIDREKSLGFKKDKAIIDHYLSLKKQYDYNKKVLDDSLVESRKYDTKAIIVQPSEILLLVKNLYKLKHTGAKILELHNIQQQTVQRSIYSKEYKHPTCLKKQESLFSSIKLRLGFNQAPIAETEALRKGSNSKKKSLWDWPLKSESKRIPENEEDSSKHQHKSTPTRDVKDDVSVEDTLKLESKRSPENEKGGSKHQHKSTPTRDVKDDVSEEDTSKSESKRSPENEEDDSKHQLKSTPTRDVKDNESEEDTLKSESNSSSEDEKDRCTLT